VFTEVTQNSTSKAVAVTVPTPIENRLRGSLERAKLNMTLSEVEYSSLERRVVAEATDAAREYEAARAGFAGAKELDAPATRERTVAVENYREGGGSLDRVLQACAEADASAASRLEAEARVLRARAKVNAAVGLRVFP
jgi:outer membrane protein TolC